MGVSVTVTVHSAETTSFSELPYFAVTLIVAVPSATAVTRPELLTVAKAVSLLSHVRA